MCEASELREKKNKKNLIFISLRPSISSFGSFEHLNLCVKNYSKLKYINLNVL